MESEDNVGNRREHKVTAARTQDPFDRLQSSLEGLPGGASTRLAAIQHTDFYGHTTTYNIRSFKTEDGVTVFVTQGDASGQVRFILPPSVLATIDRQRVSLTKQVRRRHGKRIAEERAARGDLPGFMKAKS